MENRLEDGRCDGAADEPIVLYGLEADSIVDGPGLRFAVFVQGCTHGCPGCHNPESQPSGDGSGTPSTVGAVCAKVEANPLTQGVTLTGGEPFEQARACAAIARWARTRRLSVWVYTGYLYEDLLACAEGERGLPHVDAEGASELLAAANVLVDGPFVQARHSYDLHWRGSSNQRVIDLDATRSAGALVLWESREAFPEKPPSW